MAPQLCHRTDGFVDFLLLFLDAVQPLLDLLEPPRQKDGQAI
jgi:hypothetical protein